jgi:hypothetical protein
MNSIDEFVAKARKLGLDDQVIAAKLTGNGWSATDAKLALAGGLDVPAPPKSPSAKLSDNNHPVTMVAKMSTRDTEYSIMYICLLITALGIGGVLHQLLFSMQTSDESGYWAGGSFGITMILVTLPIFTWLFLRLKRAEQKSPALLKSATRHRGVKGMIMISFLGLIIHSVIFVYMSLNSYGKFFDSISHFVITLLVAGGILQYFWRDEHRNYKED